MTLDIGQGVGSRLVNTETGVVSRDIFVDEELYKLEQERVFARAWLFIGFEDQVKKPGDYFVSRMGEESVILSRDRDNTIHVFLNSCRHRGMKVCRYDEGNTPVFTCPYHGWSYGGDGSLVGVPRYKDAYREELDKSQWGLVEVAQLANFKGLIWATWDSKAPAFEEYIGDMKPFLEGFLDKPDGSDADLEFIPGVYKWTIPCNWKWGAENFVGDAYHNPSHRSVDLVGISPTGGQGRHLQHSARGKIGANEQLVNQVLNISHHGHGRLSFVLPENYEYMSGYPGSAVAEQYFKEADTKRRKLLGDRARVNPGMVGTFFPNGTTGTAQHTMCVWQPNGPDSTEQWRWYFVQRDAPQEVKDLIRHFMMRYGGPAGLTEEDDMENWNYAHKASKGTIAHRYPYHYAMGLARKQRGDPFLNSLGLMKNGLVTWGVTEQNQLHMHGMWAKLMDLEWDEIQARPDW